MTPETAFPAPGRPVLESIDDHARVAAMLVSLAGDVSDLRSTIIPGPPPSKARPRFSKSGHTYTPAESRAAEKVTRSHLRRFMAEPATGNVAVCAVFYRPNAQRIDTDNMLKHLLDSANKVLWNDDSQVTAISAVTELDASNPRTLLAIAPHMSTLLRGSDDVLICEHCSKPYPRNGGNRGRRYCSKDCSYAARVNVRQPIPCRQCGTDFQRTTSRQVLCSEECRAAWLTGRNKADASPNSECSQCGTELTHKRGGRCRNCWRADPLSVPAEAPQVAQPALPIEGAQQ